MLSRTNVVDSILDEPSTGGVELVCSVESGEWNHPNALDQLKDKLDGYAHFALDGEMLQRYPHFEGKPVTISVVSVDPVPSLFEKWVTAIGRVFSKDGVSMKLVVLPQSAAPSPAA